MSDAQQTHIPEKPFRSFTRAFFWGGVSVTAIYYGFAVDRTVGLAVSAVGGLITLFAFMNFLHTRQFWSDQKWRQDDIIDPAPIFGDKGLATSKHLAAWNMFDTAGLPIGAVGDRIAFYNPYAPGNAHMQTVAPPAAGKSSCLAFPALLHWPSNNAIKKLKKIPTTIVVDIKGELSWGTALHRSETMKQNVILLNPYAIFGMPTTRWNPFGCLRQDLARGGREFLGLIYAFALILIPDPEGGAGDNAVFPESARALVAILMAWLSIFDPGNCNPMGLRKLVFAPRTHLATIAIDLMMSDLLNCALQELGHELEEMLDKNGAKFWISIRRYAKNALAIWNPADPIAESVQGSDFDLDAVLEGNHTLYICLPGSKTATHSQWVQLLLKNLFYAIEMHENPAPVLTIADEAPFVLPPDTHEAMAQLRARGLRVWQFHQSRKQTEKRFERVHRELNEELCSFRQFCLVADHELANDLSKASGVRTMTDFGHSQQFFEGAPLYSTNFSKREAPVLRPDEILHAPRWASICWMTGKPLTVTKMVPFWKIWPLRERAAQWSPLEGDLPNDPTDFSMKD